MIYCPACSAKLKQKIFFEEQMFFCDRCLHPSNSTLRYLTMIYQSKQQTFWRALINDGDKKYVIRAFQVSNKLLLTPINGEKILDINYIHVPFDENFHTAVINLFNKLMKMKVFT